jgi:hypothetical protein
MKPSIEGATELAEYLRKQISRLGGEHRSRDTWTIAVQHALDDYRIKKGWEKSEVLPPPNRIVPADGKKYSFLLDFVVWRRDFEGGKEGAWIACESEWNLNDDSVIEDFHKLLSFRAPYKIMIYDVKNNQGLRDACHRRFENAISTYQWHGDDEIYIFLEFVDGDGIARIYTSTPDKNSNLKELLQA